MVDEADKLFHENFLEQIDPIFAACTNTNLQRCLFSATLDDRVETLAKSVMVNPVKITIGAQNSVADSITQQLKFVGNGACAFHLDLCTLLDTRNCLSPFLILVLAVRGGCR